MRQWLGRAEKGVDTDHKRAEDTLAGRTEPSGANFWNPLFLADVYWNYSTDMCVTYYVNFTFFVKKNICKYRE